MGKVGWKKGEYIKKINRKAVAVITVKTRKSKVIENIDKNAVPPPAGDYG